MDWIEELFHVSPDGGNGWLEWLYLVLPLGAVFLGSLSGWWFWHHHQQRKKVKRILLAPDDLGIAKLELGKLRVEGETPEIPFAFEADVMTRLKLAADKRGTTTGDWMTQAVVRAMEDPVALAEIERRYVRRR